jgi:hypothetical protein
MAQRNFTNSEYRKEYTPMRMKSFVVQLCLLLIFAIPAWGLDLNPGRFEITASVEMQGVPAGMPGTTPAQTMGQCLTEQNPLPNSSSSAQNCAIKDIQTEGNSITYTMVCEQQGMKIESSGEMIYKGDSIEGTTKTAMGPSAGGITVITRIQGKRIGECDNSDSPPDIATKDDPSISMSGNEGESDSQTDDDSDACTNARFRIRSTHTFNWSPGRVTDQILVNGNTTMGAVCFVGTGTTEENPQQCRLPYSNTGHIQTDAGRCDVSGKSQALLEVIASCSKDNYLLDITEYQDPDAGVSGKMDCPQIPFTQPHATYYPGTISRITFPTSQQTHTANESGPDVSGSFEYAKSWEITAISDAPCEDIKMLKLYLEAALKRAELYKELLPQANNANHLDQLVKDALIEEQANATNSSSIDDIPITAGETRVCKEGTLKVFSLCVDAGDGGTLGHPLCDWLDQGTKAHENQHYNDAQDTLSFSEYCYKQDKNQARVASEWEINAINAEVEVYRKILDELKDLFPECFE